MERLWLQVIGHNPITDEFIVQEVNEQDIQNNFYPEWLQEKIAEYGQEWVDQNLTFENCLQDWAQKTGAWQLK